MKKVDVNFKYLILLWAILILLVIPTYAHQGRFFTDCGREAFWPTQILAGKILYKDIFCVYGPFAYLFNAFLFKLFGINLNVLYMAGLISTFAMVTLLFLIGKRFLPVLINFSIGVFTIVAGVTSLDTFNFIFPYSYAMLYGVVSVLAAIWLLLKYNEFPEKTYYLYLSSFFTGLCIMNKQEFLPYLFVFLYGVFKIKRLNIKEYFYIFLSLLIVPILCFGFLYFQGLRLNDLKSAVVLMKRLSQSPSLVYFYNKTGAYLNLENLIRLLKLSVKSLTSFCIFVFAFSYLKKDLFIVRKVLLIILMLMAVALLIFKINAIFVFLPMLVAILAIFNYKKLSTDNALAILVLGILAISIKSFGGSYINRYGLFTLSPLIITFLTMIKIIFKDKINNYSLCIYILIAALLVCYRNISELPLKQNLIETSRGKIYVNDIIYSTTQDTINYIIENTKPTDRVVIFPEAPMINFLTDRKTDDIYGVLMPPVLETFGENNMIEHFKKTKPEYIIFYTLNTFNDYKKKFICINYAYSFCSYVDKNYNIEKTFDSKDFRFIIYKR